MYLLEATANGTDFRGWRVPDSLDTGFNFQIPTGQPLAKTVLLAAAPAGSGADAYSAISYANFGSQFTVTLGTPGSIVLAAGGTDITSVSDATGTPDATTFLRGDNTWTAVSASSATAGGTAGVIQYNTAGALDAEAAFKYVAATNTLSITQNGTDPTIVTGDGTYSWGHTPMVGIEGVLEVDGNSFFDGDLTVGGTLTATIAIGDIATAAGNNEFLITPDSDSGDTLVLQARDIDAAGWDNVVTITNGNTPTLTIAADGGTSFSDGNITNVGSIALDSIGADGTNISIVAASGTVTVESVVFTSGALTGVTDLTMGSATVDSGPITMIEGAQTGDPQVILDLTGDANGDFSITTDTGDIGLISAATIQLKAAAEDLVLTAASNEIDVSSGTAVALVDFGTINLATDALDLSDGNITNVGDIALDSLSADGTNISIVAASGTVTVESVVFTGGALTGVTNITSDAAEINGSITLQNDETISNATDTQIALTSNGNENLIIDLDTATDNQVQISSSTGVTDLDFSALNITTTGVIKGRASYGADITGAVAHNTTATHMVFYHFTAAATATLDAAADAGFGAQVCYRVRDAGEAAVIEVDNADKININGTAGAAGAAITATGAGESVCLVATTDTDGSGTNGWETWGATSGWALP